MADLTSDLTVALNAMTRETRHLLFHASNLARDSWNWGRCPVSSGNSESGLGVTESVSLFPKSVGRSGNRRDSALLESGIEANKVNCGTELAVDLVHIANVQLNFEAEAKSVSTIDAMMDTILNMRV